MNSIYDWINTKPPIPYPDVTRLIQTIEQSNLFHIDGSVLATALKFVYFFGLRKVEIINLKIGGVLDERYLPLGEVVINQDRISVPLELMHTVVGHSNYLRTFYRKKFNLDQPLFPNRKRNQYDDTTLQRQIDYFAKGSRYKVTFERIRRAGICRYYDELQYSAYYSDSQALEFTASFARVISIYHARDILIDDIRPWGHKKTPTAPSPYTVSLVSLTSRLQGTVNISETMALEIMEEIPKTSFSKFQILQEFSDEFLDAIWRSRALAFPVKLALSDRMYSHLQAIGFNVDQVDGRLIEPKDIIWEE